MPLYEIMTEDGLMREAYQACVCVCVCVCACVCLGLVAYQACA